MKYLLDTNIVINVMRYPRRAAATKFLNVPAVDMAISIVTKAELLVGPNRAKSHANELEKVNAILQRVQLLPFDEECAQEFGRIAASLFDKGWSVDGMDVEIAATARRHQLIMVTHDVKDYGRIDKLQVENWITDNP